MEVLVGIAIIGGALMGLGNLLRGEDISGGEIVALSIVVLFVVAMIYLGMNGGLSPDYGKPIKRNGPCQCPKCIAKKKAASLPTRSPSPEPIRQAMIMMEIGEPSAETGFISKSPA